MKADECWSALIVSVCCAVSLILVPNASTDIIWKLKLGMPSSSSYCLHDEYIRTDCLGTIESLSGYITIGISQQSCSHCDDARIYLHVYMLQI